MLGDVEEQHVHEETCGVVARSHEGAEFLHEFVLDQRVFPTCAPNCFQNIFVLVLLSLCLYLADPFFDDFSHNCFKFQYPRVETTVLGCEPPVVGLFTQQKYQGVSRLLPCLPQKSAEISIERNAVNAATSNSGSEEAFHHHIGCDAFEEWLHLLLEAQIAPFSFLLRSRLVLHDMPLSDGCYSRNDPLQKPKIEDLRNGPSLPLPLLAFVEDESVAEDQSEAVLVEMGFGEDGVLFRSEEVSEELRIDEGECELATGIADDDVVVGPDVLFVVEGVLVLLLAELLALGEADFEGLVGVNENSVADGFEGVLVPVEEFFGLPPVEVIQVGSCNSRNGEQDWRNVHIIRHAEQRVASACC